MQKQKVYITWASAPIDAPTDRIEIWDFYTNELVEFIEVTNEMVDDDALKIAESKYKVLSYNNGYQVFIY